MEEYETVTQKYVVSFCKYLPSHVENWSSVIQEVVQHIQALENYSEQIYHVERAKLSDVVDNFDSMQDHLQYRILTEIDEEILKIKLLKEQLNSTNFDLKNKLSTLEKSSVNLDWEANSPLIKGNATQPSLSRVLQDGLDFWIFFSSAIKTINEHFKSLDVRNKKSVQQLRDAFQVNLQEHTVSYFLAITQYVGNEKAVE